MAESVSNKLKDLDDKYVSVNNVNPGAVLFINVLF